MLTPASMHKFASHTLAKTRKRKRLQELAAETESSPFMAFKRRSSSTDTSATSMSPNSFLDVTYTPDKSEGHLGNLSIRITGCVSKYWGVLMW